MNAAAVIALAAIAVEETVLLQRILIVPGYTSGERALIVVVRSNALDIIAVDVAVLIIVDTVAALSSGFIPAEDVRNAGIIKSNTAVVRARHTGIAIANQVGIAVTTASGNKNNCEDG
jgi:hypothetical protein